MEYGPHVFLFDADADGTPGYYGGFYDPAFLQALSVADPEGLTSSRIKRGDAMLSRLVQNVSAVNKSARQHGYTLTHDRALYATIIWDLSDSLGERWHSLNIDEAASIMGKHSIHCIMLPSLPFCFRDCIDKSLRQTAGYIGGFEIDPGNPVQRKAFCDLLVYVAFVTNGQIVREFSYEGEQEIPFVGADTFKPNGARWVEYCTLAEEGPPDLGKVQLSERGAATAALVQRKRRNTMQDRVIQSLLAASWTDAAGHEYSFKGDWESDDILEAILPDGKFTSYLFNLEHKDGAGKAKFFIEKLGILPSDWRYLAAQFYGGLILSRPRNLELKRWKEGCGAKFEVDISIIGRNGRAMNVRTGWMMEPGSSPRLSTAYPLDKALDPVQPGVPPVVLPDLSGDEKWSTLFDLAFDEGDAAQAELIPTPIKIEGYPIIPEGLIGTAIVVVKDARRDFARWLIKSGSGERYYKGGAYFSCPAVSESYERAKAFAAAFARVLHWNGVAATVYSAYD